MLLKNQKQFLEEIQKYDSIVILGSSNIGRTMYRYMKSQGVESKVKGFADNSLGPVKESKLFQLPNQRLVEYGEYKENALLLICVAPRFYHVAEQLRAQAGGKNEAFVEYEFYCSISKEENVPLDFLCAGFTKCGTTSLQAVLRKHKQIYLPKQKETNYFHWRRKYEDSPERHKRKYYNEVGEGMMIGDIEPTYHEGASAAYECYGKDLKLIFMMRNPADATYSYFRMMMRRTKKRKQVEYYRKFKKFDVRMFDLYIEDYILSGKEKRYCYADCIEQYLKYFDLKNIKFVFLEEIIQNPTKVMDEIQEFIGVKRKKYTQLPYVNSGKAVSKNYWSARINHYLFRWRLGMKGNTSSFMNKLYFWVQEIVRPITLVDNREKMTEESHKVLNEYYKDNVKRLEKLCGRSLEGLWY